MQATASMPICRHRDNAALAATIARMIDDLEWVLGPGFRLMRFRRANNGIRDWLYITGVSSSRSEETPQQQRGL